MISYSTSYTIALVKEQHIKIPRNCGRAVIAREFYAVLFCLKSLFALKHYPYVSGKEDG